MTTIYDKNNNVVATTAVNKENEIVLIVYPGDHYIEITAYLENLGKEELTEEDRITKLERQVKEMKKEISTLKMYKKSDRYIEPWDRERVREPEPCTWPPETYWWQLPILCDDYDNCPVTTDSTNIIPENRRPTRISQNGCVLYRHI